MAAPSSGSCSTDPWMEEYRSGRALSYAEKLMDVLHRNEIWILVRAFILECGETKPTVKQVRHYYIYFWNSNKVLLARVLPPEGV